LGTWPASGSSTQVLDGASRASNHCRAGTARPGASCWALHHVDGNLQPGGLRAEVDPLRLLYSLPTVVVVAYLRRVLAGPRGKLWFGAHSRAAPEEMRSVGRALQCAL
jgi:hypothetical protein